MWERCIRISQRNKITRICVLKGGAKGYATITSLEDAGVCKLAKPLAYLSLNINEPFIPWFPHWPWGRSAQPWADDKRPFAKRHSRGAKCLFLPVTTLLAPMGSGLRQPAKAVQRAATTEMWAENPSHPLLSFPVSSLSREWGQPLTSRVSAQPRSLEHSF